MSNTPNAIGVELRLNESGYLDPDVIAIAFSSLYERLLCGGFDETARFTSEIDGEWLRIKAEKLPEEHRAVLKAVKAYDKRLDDETVNSLAGRGITPLSPNRLGQFIGNAKETIALVAGKKPGTEG